MWHGAQPPKPTMNRWPTCDRPCSRPIFGLWGSSLETSGRNGERKTSASQFLNIFFWATFRIIIAKQRERCPFKSMFHSCPPENHPEAEALVCCLYSHIPSSLLTWGVSQQPLKCTYLTPSLHFKAPHLWLPTTSVANLTLKPSSAYNHTPTSFTFAFVFLLSPDPDKNV